MTSNIRRRPLGALVLIGLCASLILLAFGVAQAAARSLVTHSLTKTVDAHELVEHPNNFEINSLAVDEHAGYLYEANRYPEITKFKLDGTLASWTAPQLAGATTIIANPVTGENYNPSTGGKLAVDNTNGPYQGRIYLVDHNYRSTYIHAFEPDGIEVTEANSGENWPLDNTDVTPAQFGPFLVTVDEDGNIWEVEENGFLFWKEFSPTGERMASFRQESSSEGFDVDSQGNFYVASYGGGGPGKKYNSNAEPIFDYGFSEDLEVDRVDDNLFTVRGPLVSQYEPDGTRVDTFATGGGFHPQIAVDSSTNTVYVGNAGTIQIFGPGPAKVVPDVTTDSSSDYQATSVEVHGSVNPDSVATTSCAFEYGPAEFSPSKSVPCDQGNVLTGSAKQEVTATLPELVQGNNYYYRLVVGNAKAEAQGVNRSFAPSAIPSSKGLFASSVRADSAIIHTQIDAGGAPATYHVEYGTAPCASNPCASGKAVSAGNEVGFKATSVKIEDLQPGTTYYYRIVATNQSGTYEASEEGTFTTFHKVEFGDDCPNAHVRQQTGSALLRDCRAYELVSAGYAGGYDVESDLSPGQEPAAGYPDAANRALYSIHAGAIPGIGAPANLGPDPYLATRGPSGWSTEYVGIPSDLPAAAQGGPFASALLEANPSLTTFAFGGPDICSPCFPDGSTNVPVRLPDGELIEGMAGSEGGAAEPSGDVRKAFSADGVHFVFGTVARLEANANSSGTDTTIYERDLSSDSTEVISTLPDESTMQNGAGVAELDVSADGSRTVVGEAVGAPDADGNQYYHLYMHLAGSRRSIDLMPGSTSGALFDGMTADGSTVYLTSRDPLTTASDQDTDTSADIFRADLSGTTATLSRVSAGAGAGNSDSCDPAGGWNSVAGGKNCDVVAIAGGGGVASQSGTIYFVSPEVLDTTGAAQPVQDQPNLYADDPGSAPRFVATVDSSVGKPPPPPPTHELNNPAFRGGFETPGNLAVNQKTGDLYVGSTETISRFHANGEPSPFSGLGGSNEITGAPYYGYGENEIAVDSSDSPYSGDVYVATNGEQVVVYGDSGEEIGALTGLGEACGVSVDQSNGDVYVGSYPGKITRFRPKSAAVLPVGNLSYEAQEGVQVSGAELCNIDVSDEGHVYEWPYYGGEIRQIATSNFDTGFPSVGGKAFAGGIEGPNLQTEPGTGIVFVDSGTSVRSFLPDGTPLETFGSFPYGRGIGVDAKDQRVYVASENGKVARYDAVAAPYEVIDNPFVRHGVTRAGVHSYEDFQVTPSGRFAVFPTKQPLKAGFNNGGFTEIYRYDESDRGLTCASCQPSNGITEGAASLAAKGLSVTEDGTTFFNTTDAIAPRDLDGKVDAYEFGKDGEGGETPELISTGVSPFNSSLLGVSRDGTDAFFFTRDTLVPQDENGSLVKLYDARVGGGFEFFPAEVPCKASDECHGAGTPSPPPPGIGTLQGATGNPKGEAGKKPACRKGRTRKHGKCVKKGHHRRKSSKKQRRSHHRGAGR